MCHTLTHQPVPHPGTPRNQELSGRMQEKGLIRLSKPQCQEMNRKEGSRGTVRSESLRIGDNRADGSLHVPLLSLWRRTGVPAHCTHLPPWVYPGYTTVYPMYVRTPMIHKDRGLIYNRKNIACVMNFANL